MIGTFEGGVRGAAMVHSPLLPAATRGSVSNALIHLTDWCVMLPFFAQAWRSLVLALTLQWIHSHRHATFAALAGVSAADTGPVAPDGYNVWPALASGGSVPSPRTFIIHEYDELEGIFAYRSVRLPNLVLFGLLLWKHL